jgi:serine/threonine protein kinase
MSPEQCSQSSNIDSRSDIYSFGVILYEMLVGHVPFSGESPTIVMMKHLQEPVPSVIAERSDIPPSIGKIISRAMAKAPDDRYQSISDLLEDLTIAAGIPGRTPSGTLEPSATPPIVHDDLDEVTVVRPRAVTPSPLPYRAPVTVPIMPPAATPTSGFKPARILIPAAVAVLVVFGMFYLFSRNSAAPAGANSNTNQGLIADPNSQPVQVTSPPSGRDEAGIPSGGNINTSNQNSNQNANANANANASVTPPELNPSPESSTNTNSNSNKPAPIPPAPTRTVSPTDQPLPTPASTATPTPKSSPAPAKPSPTDVPPNN